MSNSKNSDKPNLRIHGAPYSQVIMAILAADEHKKLIDVLESNDIKILNTYSFSINKEELESTVFEYFYWKDKIYELSINETKIINYNKTGTGMDYTILILGVLWTSFQLWVLYKLIVEGQAIYDNNIKPNSKWD